MTKTIIFDTDGMVIHREMNFSDRFSKDFGVLPEKIIPFFKNEFKHCLVGKADLKEELSKYLDDWNWEGTVDDLLFYWFSHEQNVNETMLENVKQLREKGVRCYLSTNNEEYRVTYLLEELALKDFFDGMFASCRLGFTKPDLEFWNAVYEQLDKLEKSKVFVWDDDKENVASAKKFGFQTEFYSDFDSYRRSVESFIG